MVVHVSLEEMRESFSYIRILNNGGRCEARKKGCHSLGEGAALCCGTTYRGDEGARPHSVSVK